MKMRAINPPLSPRPMLMLSEYDSAEVDRLCQACRDLAAGRIQRFSLHEQQWVDSIDQCRFFWQYSSKDVGVRFPQDGFSFVLEYSDEAWLEVEGKLAAVRQPRKDQLNELTMEGDVAVIISADGLW